MVNLGFGMTLECHLSWKLSNNWEISLSQFHLVCKPNDLHGKLEYMTREYFGICGSDFVEILIASFLHVILVSHIFLLIAQRWIVSQLYHIKFILSFALDSVISQSHRIWNYFRRSKSAWQEIYILSNKRCIINRYSYKFKCYLFKHIDCKSGIQEISCKYFLWSHGTRFQ